MKHKMFSLFALSLFCPLLLFAQGVDQVAPLRKHRVEFGASGFWRENSPTYDNSTRYHLSYYRVLSTEKGWFAKAMFGLHDLESNSFPYAPKEGRKFNFTQAELALGRQFRLGQSNSFLMPSLGLATLFGREYQTIITQTVTFPDGEVEREVLASEITTSYQFAPQLTLGYIIDMDFISIGFAGQYTPPVDGRYSYSLGATVSRSF